MKTQTFKKFIPQSLGKNVSNFLYAGRHTFVGSMHEELGGGVSSHDNVGSKGREQNDKRCGLCFDVMLFRGVQEGDKRLHATPA